MTTLSDPILVNRGNPERGFRIELIFVGESYIEDKIKAMSWTGRAPVVTVILHMDEGPSLTPCSSYPAPGRGHLQGDRIGTTSCWGLP